MKTNLKVDYSEMTAGKLIYRQFTAVEAARLHEELKTTPNILGYTVRN